MDTDEQEARSHAHTGWWCVPLSSGKIAIFQHPMKPLFKIVDSWVDVLGEAREPPKEAYVSKIVMLNLEGIDL